MLSSKAKVLYDDGHHKCLMFSDLVKGSGIQSNQFLVVDGEHEAVIDPGGDLTYAALSVEIKKYMALESLDYVLASHQDPDIISSIGRWMMQTRAKVVCSRLWARFLPHLVPSYMDGYNGENTQDRIISIPDIGGSITLGDTKIYAVPAHFLHSVGNFQFYDAKSKILFSGDMGASIGDDDIGPVSNFNSHIPLMKGFHQRYMCAQKACRLWADMVRTMDVEMIVPQHGRYFQGKNMEKFLDWISELECGVDLLSEKDYQVDPIIMSRTKVASLA